MAPTVAAAPAAPVATKVKRPIPPGIQTNGVAPSRSSPSPSMSAKRAPSAVRQPSNPPATGGTTPVSARPPNRPRRDASGQALGRGQRSAGLRSASTAPDLATSPTTEPLPYGSYISALRHVQPRSMHACSSLLTCEPSGHRSVHPQEVCRAPPVAHRPPVRDAFPLRPAGGHVPVQVAHADIHRAPADAHCPPRHA